MMKVAQVPASHLPAPWKADALGDTSILTGDKVALFCSVRCPGDLIFLERKHEAFSVDAACKKLLRELTSRT